MKKLYSTIEKNSICKKIRKQITDENYLQLTTEKKKKIVGNIKERILQME